MTDEKIKEEFEEWYNAEGECTPDEKSFYGQYDTDMHEITVGFYAGFRTAERLAKIEVLEEVCKVIDMLELPRRAIHAVERMRDDRKEQNR